MRGAFLYLSKQKNLRRWMETSPQAHKLTSRFIAGLELDDALRVAEQLKSRSMLASLDYLGENIKTVGEARAARDAYILALTRSFEAQLGATISMKVTSLGLDISEKVCRENTRELVRCAHQTGSRVEFDMEDSNYTDRNLNLVYEMHDLFPGHVRAVIQAYLYRSEADIEELCRRRIPVRLCKGAYGEPPELAWQSKEDVDRSFVHLMHVLLDRGVYPAIATHDDAILREALAYVSSRAIEPGSFEFEMLYGVRRRLQEQIVNAGFRLRIYVPYGAAWYPYFVRRLAERPANVMFVARSLVND